MYVLIYVLSHANTFVYTYTDNARDARDSLSSLGNFKVTHTYQAKLLPLALQPSLLTNIIAISLASNK